ASAAALRALSLRDDAGRPSPHPVLLLEDLFAALADASLPSTALLQLDLKESHAALAGFDRVAFDRAAGPFAAHLIV
ncbi:glycerophosphodiester phosphodiesterase, partial [Mycobacterium tuberculosis]|nr:glycerophosphodiester phosphodiesterase [Mycobacterium tuberculosis]